MAASQGVQEFIEISDFTPGIASARHAAGGAQAAPADAESGSVFAQRDGTWGCYGAMTGGLHPLPGVTLEVLDPGNDWPAASKFPHWTTGLWGPPPAGLSEAQGKPILVVNATGIVTPVRTSLSETGALLDDWRQHEAETPDQLAVLYGTWDDQPSHQAGTATPRAQWSLRVWHLARRSTTALLGGRVSADVTHWLGDRVQSMGTDMRNVLRLYGLRGDRLDEALGDHRMALGMGSGSIFPIMTQTNVTYPAIRPNQPGTRGLGIVTGKISAYPRIGGAAAGLYVDAVETQNAKYTDSNNVDQWNKAYVGLSHQGRIVYQQGGSQYMGSGTVELSADVTGWFGLGDFLTGRDARGGRFMPDTPGSYGVMASMNANELLLIKHSGGGCSVRGSVTSPQVVNLPGLPSINGATNIPTVTIDGVIFGARDGVYAWNGEDTAVLISPQLEGCFWLPDGTPSIEDAAMATLDYSPRGKFNSSGPLLYAPNNWVRDSRTQSWFRLAPTWTESNDDHDGATYRNYETSGSGKVYAVKPYVVAEDLTVAHLYDPDTPAPIFSWRSQPIGRAINRVLEVREVVATVQGHGTVEVTIYGDGLEAQRVTITVDSDRPKVVRHEVSIDCQEIEVGIRSATDAEITFTSDGSPIATPGNPAPSVYGLTVGYRSKQSVEKAGGFANIILPTPPEPFVPVADRTLTLTRTFAGAAGYLDPSGDFDLIRDIWGDFHDQLDQGHIIKSISAVRIRAFCRVDGASVWHRVLNIAPTRNIQDVVSGVPVPAINHHVNGAWTTSPAIAHTLKSAVTGVAAARANGIVLGAAASVYNTAGAAYWMLNAPTSPAPATFSIASGVIEATFTPTTPADLATSSYFDLMFRFASGLPSASPPTQYSIDRIQIDCVTGAP